MTAGRGIVHSERETSEAKAATRRLFGIQAWAALPKSHEEKAPAFAHHGTDELPRIAGEGKRVRLVMGEAYGARSPVDFPHESLFAEAVLAPGAVLPLDPDYDERAVYVASGEIDIAGDTFGEGRLLVFKPGDRISILATAQSRLMLLGGEPMDGAAPHLVEFRLVLQGAHRASQGRLARASASRWCRATRRSSSRCRTKYPSWRRGWGVGEGEHGVRLAPAGRCRPDRAVAVLAGQARAGVHWPRWRASSSSCWRP